MTFLVEPVALINITPSGPCSCQNIDSDCDGIYNGGHPCFMVC